MSVYPWRYVRSFWWHSHAPDFFPREVGRGRWIVCREVGLSLSKQRGPAPSVLQDHGMHHSLSCQNAQRSQGAWAPLDYGGMGMVVTWDRMVGPDQAPSCARTWNGKIHLDPTHGIQSETKVKGWAVGQGIEILGWWSRPRWTSSLAGKSSCVVPDQWLTQVLGGVCSLLS